jgi:hypothetical protein
VLRFFSLSRRRHDTPGSTACRVRHRHRHAPTIPVWLASVVVVPVIAGSVSAASQVQSGATAWLVRSTMSK